MLGWESTGGRRRTPTQTPFEILLQGLGKTLQCAAFLAGLIESRLIRRAIGEGACRRLGCILPLGNMCRRPIPACSCIN